MSDQLTAQPIIRMPGDNTGVVLRGEPMAFLVTGKNTRHTSMFDWTIPAGFATGLHVHRVQDDAAGNPLRQGRAVLGIGNDGRALHHRERRALRSIGEETGDLG